MSHVTKIPVLGVSDQDRNKRHRRWLDLELVGLYYLCSENKGAVQLRDYLAAALRICFSHVCKKQVFS